MRSNSLREATPNQVMRQLLGQPTALLYNATLVLFAPVLLAKKWKRSRRPRHGYELDLARWNISDSSFGLGTSDLPENDFRHLIFIGIGRSEMLLAERVGLEILKKHPYWRITWAVRDRLSIEEMRNEWPNQHLVVIPFDFAWPVAKWLAQLRPDALVFCEKFWFANLAHGAHLMGATVAVINARAPEENAAVSRLGGGFNRWILRAFDLVCVPSQQEEQVWRSLLGSRTRIRVTGSNRFDLKRPTANSDSLANWLDARQPLLAAGSTWELDEEFVLDAYARVNREISCVLLVAPRRFERGVVVAKRAEELGFRVSLRSNPQPDAQVFVLDTMGELLTAYQFACAAFIGSTLKGKGHNVAEPLLWGVPVAYGPAPGHFDVEQRQCESAGVGFRIHTPEELAAHWKRVLTDGDWRQELREKAARLFEEQGGAVERNARALEELMAHTSN